MVKGQIISDRIEVFISYSHKDETLREELEKRLSILKRQGLISTWHDRNISAGEDWRNNIDNHLNSAQIILLLISPDFLASDYINNNELNRAIERHNSGDARVIPIILRPVEWKEESFAKFQALPIDGKPITKWESLDDAFVDVTKGLKKVIDDMAKDTPKKTVSLSDLSKKESPSTDLDHQKNSKSMIFGYLSGWWSFSNKNFKSLILTYLGGLWAVFFYGLIYPDHIIDMKLFDWLAVFFLILFFWGLLIAAVSYHKKINKGIILGLTYPSFFSIFYLLFRYNRPDEVHCILWLFSVVLLSMILYLQIRKDILHLEKEISLAHKP
jgi:hypothetical protein